MSEWLGSWPCLNKWERSGALHALFALKEFQIELEAGSVCRLQPSKGLKEFQLVMVNVTKEETEHGMRLHGSCPPLLLTWLVKDVVTSGNLLI